MRPLGGRLLGTLALATLATASVGCSTGLVAGTRAAAAARFAESKACLSLAPEERSSCFELLTPFDTLEDSPYQCLYRAGVVVHSARLMGSPEGLAVVTDIPKDLIPAEALRKDGATALLRSLSNGSYSRGCIEPGLVALAWWLDADRKQPPPAPVTEESERERRRASAAKALAEIEEATSDERRQFGETLKNAAATRAADEAERRRAVRARVTPILQACSDEGKVADGRCDLLEGLTDGERVGCRDACHNAGLSMRVKLASNDCKKTWLDSSSHCEGLEGDDLTKCASACTSSAEADREVTFRYAENTCVELPPAARPSCEPSHIGTTYDLGAVAKDVESCLNRCKARRGDGARPSRAASPSSLLREPPAH